jgi:hypothetical protein
VRGGLRCFAAGGNLCATDFRPEVEDCARVRLFCANEVGTVPDMKTKASVKASKRRAVERIIIEPSLRLTNN